MKYFLFVALGHLSLRVFLFFFFNPLSCWPGEGNGTPLQYSRLANPMDRGAWKAAVHGVARSQTRLSNFTFTFHFHVLEKEMATYSSVLAWRIPGTGEPGALLSLGSHRVGYDWSDLAAAAAAAAACWPLVLILHFLTSKYCNIQGPLLWPVPCLSLI